MELLGDISGGPGSLRAVWYEAGDEFDAPVLNMAKWEVESLGDASRYFVENGKLYLESEYSAANSLAGSARVVLTDRTIYPSQNFQLEAFANVVTVTEGLHMAALLLLDARTGITLAAL